MAIMSPRCVFVLHLNGIKLQASWLSTMYPIIKEDNLEELFKKKNKTKIARDLGDLKISK